MTRPEVEGGGLGGFALDRLLVGVGWLTRHRTARGKELRVNVGAGLVATPGWLNVDSGAHLLVRWLPAPALRWLLAFTSVGADAAATLKACTYHFRDLRYGIPVYDSAAACIYTSHFLEHLAPEDALRLLKDAWRALDQGGVIRVVVPDGEEHLDGGGRRLLDRHRSWYSFESLRDLLEAVGFEHVERCGFHEGSAPDIEVLDNRPESLFVEARKPIAAEATAGE